MTVRKHGCHKEPDGLILSYDYLCDVGEEFLSERFSVVFHFVFPFLFPGIFLPWNDLYIFRFCLKAFSFHVFAIFRKYLAQIDKTALQNTDSCYVPPLVDFLCPKAAAIIRKKYQYEFIFRVDNPVFANLCLLVQVQLDKPVMPQCRGGQDFKFQSALNKCSFP